MQASLEIKSGPRAGETIVVKEGESVTVGRTANANFPLPQDTFLSRVHFAIDCGKSACRLIDRKSANGTILNGVKVSDAAELHEGDIIMAGQTNFMVHLAAAAESAALPLAAEPSTDRPRFIQPALQPAFAPAFAAAAASPQDTVAIGSWFFGLIPEGWRVVEGFGLRRHERNAFPSEVMASETVLAPGQAFEGYVESQLELVRLLVSQPQIQPDKSPAIQGAEETKAFVIRYKMDGGRRFFQRQIYARSAQYAGALAITTIESEVSAAQPFFDQIFRNLAFRRL